MRLVRNKFTVHDIVLLTWFTICLSEACVL